MSYEWENNKCLALIDAYYEHKLLWDPTDPNYYSKTRKQRAWQVVSGKMKVDVNEVKRKISSLLASFRRERGRGKKVYGPDGEQNYVSKWFAFERMQFLLDRDDSAKSNLVSMANGFPEDSLTDNFDDELTSKLDTNETGLQEKSTASKPAPQPPTSQSTRIQNKRRIRYQEQPSNKISKLSSYTHEHESENEFDLFCKSLSIQLKRMPLNRALICQQKLQCVMTKERLYQINDNADANDYHGHVNDINLNSPEALSHISYTSPSTSPIRTINDPFKMSPSSFNAQDDDTF